MSTAVEKEPGAPSNSTTDDATETSAAWFPTYPTAIPESFSDVTQSSPKEVGDAAAELQ